MNTELWQQIREVFHAAVELPPAERTSYLNRACSDVDMRKEVESLLLSHYEAGDLLEVPALKLSSESPKNEDEDPWIGDSIGPYQVIAKIGQGGMGTVYRALRVDEHYVKQVAIKLVRTGLGQGHYLRRFKNERQIMASLDHPNIARLLDGGTAKGSPYLVMEYIEGLRIDEYCDSKTLSTRDRLQLFVEVCSAVQYAHQHLVVHRDLKPGNILITSDGVPKLLDFGIAKLLEPELFLQTAELTMSQMKPMTPEFASPEQILGAPVTTSSDVYSLGVLLYRLLTGHSPYRMEGRPLHELARAISETEPMRPSLVIDHVTEETGVDGESIKLTPESVSGTRDGQPDTLRHRLEGDLDNILLKALRKEPARRYASVEQFADDLRRHLDGLPVMARKDTIRYRSVKFINRHKVGVAATVIVAFSLVGGIVATAWQAHIARGERAKAVQRFNDVRQLSNSLIFDMDTAIADLPGSTPARKILVSNAVRYLDVLSKETKGDSTLQRELATAYRKLADVQGNQFRGNLGDTPGAIASLGKMLALRQELAAANPDNRNDQFELANSYRMLSQMQVLIGDLDGGMQYAMKSLAIISPMARAEPENIEVLDKLQDVYELIGDMQGGNGLSANLGDTAGALENHRKAMEIAQKAVKLKPDDPAVRRSVAVYDIKIADDLAKQGDRNGALKSYREAMDIYQAISVGSLSTVYTREINLVYTRIGDTQLMEGDSRGALKSYRAAMDLAENLASADPQNALAREDLATGYAMLGKASGDSGKVKDGRAYLQKGISIIEKEVARDPQHSDKRRILGLLYVWHGQLLAHMGSLAKALVEYKKTIALFEPITSAEPKDIEARMTLAATNAKIAAIHGERGETAAAVALYQKVISAVETFAMATPPNPQAQYTLADSYFGMGNLFQSQAAKRNISEAKQIEYWTQSRSWFERSWAAWRQVNNPGKMSPSGFDTEGPSLVKERLDLCDEALLKLKPESPASGF